MKSVIDPYDNYNQIEISTLTLGVKDGIKNLSGSIRLTGTDEWVPVAQIPIEYLPKNITYFICGAYNGKTYAAYINTSGSLRIYSSGTNTDLQVFMNVTYL